jgi:hypothetical protein
MGQYFIIVNPVKRQYIDAIRFSENIKASGYMRGYQTLVVALLVCNGVEVHHTYGPLAGSWCGDPVIAAGDDHGQADQYGIKTSTDADPTRNLNRMAHEEFEDISYQAIAMLCRGREGFAQEGGSARDDVWAGVAEALPAGISEVRPLQQWSERLSLSTAPRRAICSIYR